MTIVTEEIISATGSVWQLRDADNREILTLMQKHELPEIVARLLVGRGISHDEAADFLNPTIKNLLPNPFHLLDMEKGATHIADAIINNKNIAIFGDYDVDGATSSALLKRFFNSLKKEVTVYIPDRMKEGYGPNTKALLALKEQGADICITVDCGTSSFEPIAEAKKANLDVIVIDHHLGSEKLPEALAIINPSRLDETSEYKHLAAVGVCFLFAVAVTKILRERNFFKDHKEPNLIELLDIVALGTVCDVVPLKNINRAFVKQGLKIMSGRKNTGLAILSDIAGLSEEPAAYHLGFVLGPRINAGGRVGRSSLGSILLSSEDRDESYKISVELDKYNKERQTIEQMVLESANAQIESGNMATAPLIFAKGDGWHQGVIGIVAGRIKENYNRPVAVISIENGIGKASARSITGVDFGSAIVAANQSGLLIAGGGHSMAAGFSVEENKIDALYEFLSARFANDVEKNSQKIIKADGYLSIPAITPMLADMINRAGPFGMGNPEPRFIIPNCYIISIDILGENHIKCIIGDNASGVSGGTIKAMAFRAIGTELGDALLNNKGKRIHLACKVKLNNWQGISRTELIVEDLGY